MGVTWRVYPILALIACVVAVRTFLHTFRFGDAEGHVKTGTLTLHRFNGDELYAVQSATLEASEKDGAFELSLYVDASAKPIQTLPDTASVHTQPAAEVHITLNRLAVSRLVGRRFSVPASWSEEKKRHVSNFYYGVHINLDRIVVRVLEQQGSKLLIHWTAKTRDVNYDDGSKPDTTVQIKAWFTFKGMRKWLRAEQSAAADRPRELGQP